MWAPKLCDTVQPTWSLNRNYSTRAQNSKDQGVPAEVGQSIIYIQTITIVID